MTRFIQLINVLNALLICPLGGKVRGSKMEFFLFALSKAAEQQSFTVCDSPTRVSDAMKY